MGNKIKYLYALIFLAPTAIFAEGTAKIKDLDTFLGKLQTWMDLAAKIIIGLTVLAIMWGLFQYLVGQSKGDDKSKVNGKNIIIWGVVALAVMVGIWGLVSIVTGTFGLEGNGPINSQVIPKFK